MNKRYLVYIHTNKINGKVYIGQTCQNLSTGGALMDKDM